MGRKPQNLIIALLSLGLAGCSTFQIFQPSSKVVLIHINDIYETGASGDDPGRVARLKTVVENAKKDNPHVLLTVSGDFLSPSVLSAAGEGKQIIEILNMLGVDLVTMGNHEFDLGSEALKRRIEESDFTWVCTNVFEDGEQFHGTSSFAIRSFGPIKAGFIGLLDKDAVDFYKVPENVDIMDPKTAAKRAINALRKERVDIIIALTHMDENEDESLAKEVEGIDIILGGHDHSGVIRKIGGTTLVKSEINVQTAIIASAKIRRGVAPLVSTHHVHLDDNIPMEPHVAGGIKEKYLQAEAYLDEEIGETLAELDGREESLGMGEANMGSFAADAMREKMVSDMAIINAGAFYPGGVVDKGPITRRQLFNLTPYDVILCKVKIMGHVLKDALEHGVSEYGKDSDRFLHVSGIRYKADVSRAPGDRILDITVGGKPLAPGKVYTLALNDYLLNGGGGYTMFKNAQKLIGQLYGGPVASAIESVISDRKVIDPKVDGRIEILGY